MKDYKDREKVLKSTFRPFVYSRLRFKLFVHKSSEKLRMECVAIPFGLAAPLSICSLAVVVWLTTVVQLISLNRGVLRSCVLWPTLFLIKWPSFSHRPPYPFLQYVDPTWPISFLKYICKYMIYDMILYYIKYIIWYDILY